MSEKSSAQSSSPAKKGLFKSLLSYCCQIGLILIAVWTLKVVLSDPDTRYEEVCYSPYIVGEFFYVRVIGFISIQESPSAYLARSRKSSEKYQDCLSWSVNKRFLRIAIPHVNTNEATR